MSQMKNGAHKPLYEILKNNSYILLPYSTSHIADIFSSLKDTREQKEYINSDLEFITELTKNWCLFNSGESIILDQEDPKKMFQNKVDEGDLFSSVLKDIYEIGVKNNISLNSENTEKIKLLEESLNSDLFKKYIEDPKNREHIDFFYPGLIENPSAKGMIDSVIKMFINLNEGEQYKELRNEIQKGLDINFNKLENSNEPFKDIDDKYVKKGFEFTNPFEQGKHCPKWFDEIVNAYIKLDMHGFQQDKVRVNEKKRKETMRNTNEDAMHLAFSSMCDFYIIDDKKSFRKSKKVFEELQVNTKVFKSHEFIEYFNNYLFVDDISLHFRRAINLYKSGSYYENKDDKLCLRLYNSPYYFFNFFNRIICAVSIEGDIKTFYLSKELPKNGNIYHFELTTLYDTICKLFGEDVEEKGNISREELRVENWGGRKWRMDDSVFNLKIIERNINFYVN